MAAPSSPAKRLRFFQHAFEHWQAEDVYDIDAYCHSTVVQQCSLHVGEEFGPQRDSMNSKKNAKMT